MPPELSELIEWAQEAAEVLRAGYEQTHDIQHKGLTDLVTEIDQRAEALLIRRILARYPQHSIFAEESGRRTGETADTWYIDPVDGTINYAHGVPYFCVSLAYAHAGQLMLGVIVDPLRNECFSAQRGAGAWLNGSRRLRVSDAQSLLECVIGTGFPGNIAAAAPGSVEDYARFARRTSGVRVLSSAALDLCAVAAGRLDAAWNRTLNAYDVAAGGLIAEEAGAHVTTVDGDPAYLRAKTSILAANPVIHEQMLAVLRESDQVQ